MGTPKPDLTPKLKQYDLRSSTSPTKKASNSPGTNTPSMARRKDHTPNPLTPDTRRAERHQSEVPSDSEEEYHNTRGTPRRRNVTREEMSDPEVEHENIAPVNKSYNLSGKMLGIGVVVLLVAAWIYPKLQATEIPTTKTCRFDKLRKEYNGQDKFLWDSLEVGLENILNKKSYSPAVFSFLLKQNPTNEKVLINKFAARACECFNPTLRPTYLKAEDFTSEDAVDDYGAVIEKYKTLVNEEDVVLIANLNDIPPNVARALHSITDVHNPVVKRVVIFLTLEVPSLEGKVIEIAEKTLLNMWNTKIKDNELRPLISRVTDQVLMVKR